jgi:hypothetical protein
MREAPYLVGTSAFKHARPQRRGSHGTRRCGTDLDGSWSGRSNDSMLDDILRSGAKRAGVATFACVRACVRRGPATRQLAVLRQAGCCCFRCGETSSHDGPSSASVHDAVADMRVRRGQQAAAALRLSPGAKMVRAGDPAITHAPHVNPFFEHPNPPINLNRAVRRAQ